MSKNGPDAEFVEALTQKEESSVREMVNKLLELTGVDYSTEILFDKTAKTLFVNIESEKSVGLLIGGRGRTINSLQKLISSMVRGDLAKAVRVSVNVGDWREKEQDKIIDVAKKTAERAINSKEDQFLYNLSPSERRIVHTTLADRTDVTTESVGEEKERYLIVHPK